MFEVGIVGKFHARHYLVGDFGEETQPHGHDYRVEWTCRRDELDQNGFSVDIALMEEALEVVLAGMSGVLLNDREYFRGKQPSVEHLALFLWRELKDALGRRGFELSGLTGTEVRIWESDTAWASYSTEDPGA